MKWTLKIVQRVPRPEAAAARGSRELFIRNKYEKKEFLGKRETVLSSTILVLLSF
jgi:hypothetical protein